MRSEQCIDTPSGFSEAFSVFSVCLVPCCFTSMETIRTVTDGETRTAPTTFTQFPRSDKVCVCTSVLIK